MSRKIIIAISGWKQSGKDSIASCLLHDFKISKETTEVDNESINKMRSVQDVCIGSFADGIRSTIEAIFNIGQEHMTTKEMKIEETYHFFDETKSYRDLMIHVGENMKKIFGLDIWAKSIEAKIHKFFKDTVGTAIYVIPDVRYKVELDMLKRMKYKGFEVYHICVFRKCALPQYIKDGYKITDPIDFEIIKEKYNPDYSEYQWIQENKSFFTAIYNDGTIFDLTDQVREKIIDRIL